MVGCVVVDQDRCIGEGWHQQFGEGHAEVNALRQIGEGIDLSKATAYVTLEPCSHVGKTPPCARLLTERGVGRVVVAMEDPNPMVSGRGIELLREAGVDVEVGCLAQEAKSLNARFVHAMTQPTPWVTLKWAQSSDGFIDPETRALPGRGSHALTGKASARWTHGLRAQHDGILVGMRTWLVDAPRLNVRAVPGHSPRPMVLTHGQTPPPTKWTRSEEETLPATMLHPLDGLGSDAMKAWGKAGHATHCMNAPWPTGPWWHAMKKDLGCEAVLVEGGATLAQQVLDTPFWNELHVLTATGSLGQGLRAPSVPAWSPSQSMTMGEDVVDVWHPISSHL
jgi:diaminohydroxyphosphoribosylaminopyrimidine deaminase/5-amino-6-(5-phosphoribosylamino)uracil reductase